MRDMNLKLKRLLVMVLMLGGLSHACFRPADEMKSTGVFDMDRLGISYADTGFGTSKTFEWRHISTGKKFLSLKIEGFDESEYQFIGDGGNVYSANRPQPENTTPVYLSFNKSGEPFLDKYSKSLERAQTSKIQLEFLGFFPRKKPNG